MTTLNTRSNAAEAYFPDGDPLRPTVCHHCAGNAFQPVDDPFNHPDPLQPCPTCDGTGLAQQPDEDTLYTCRRCNATWSAWDLVVNLDVHGYPELCCPCCARREALAAPEQDGVDLDALPGGPCSMPL